MSQKDKPRQITVAEMAPHVHSFGINENKVNKISNWLISWIENALKSGRIKPYDLLPAKGDLAFHIGVSKGTIQNVFRYVEDCGFVESKQRIGTYIKGEESAAEAVKLTSKRELAVIKIKEYLLSNNYKAGDYLISARKLAQITGISNSTIRIAAASLVSEGILKKQDKNFVITTMDFDFEKLETLTLVEKIAANIRSFIQENLSEGDKLPTNIELAHNFSVSVKTIHDAVKLLSKEGILHSRRGQYGTIISDSGAAGSVYHYERIELKIRHFIAENCEVGAKLPSIMALSENYGVSPKTIKKALDNLAEDGYLTFVRGRYGGTFVTDLPQGVNEAYKWLALSADYVSNT